MSQQQYNSILSSMLQERHALAKLRAELEERREKICQSCKKFRHLAQNCKNKREGEKKEAIPPNKFEVLNSQVMQCRIKETMIKRQEVIRVECYKCKEEEHKCRECLLWRKTKERKV